MTHWTDFVKDYSKKHKITYKEALKDANCSSEYHKSRGVEKFIPVQDLAGNFVPVKNENISMTITEIKKRGRPKKYFTQEEAKKAKISKTIAGAKKRKQKGEGIIDDVKNLASKFGSFVTGTAKKIKDTAVALVEGRNDYPPKVRDIISKYGDKIITGITINRTPLGKPLMTALQIASGNTFSQKLQNTPYDKLFHLFMCVEFANGKITLEKNEVINGEDGCKLPKDTESKIIDSSSIPNGLSLTDALNKTKERMGGKFFVYSAKDNNCQDFLSSFLQANNIGNSNDISWIKQETKVLFEGNDRLRKIANTLTDIGARVDILKQGVGAKKIGKGPKVVNNSDQRLLIFKGLNNPVFTPFITADDREQAVTFLLEQNRIQSGDDIGVVREFIRDNWANLRQFSSNQDNYPDAPPYTIQEQKKRSRGEDLTDTRRPENTGAVTKAEEAKILKNTYKKKTKISTKKERRVKRQKNTKEGINPDIDYQNLFEYVPPEEEVRTDAEEPSNKLFKYDPYNDDNDDEPNVYDPLQLELGFGLKSKKGGMMGNANVISLTTAQGNSILNAFNGLTHQIRLDQLQNAIANIQGGNVRERFRNYALITGGASVANFYMRTYDAILAFEQDGATDTEGAGLKSGTFTRQLKEFNRANKKNLDLHSFAMMVLANPDKFNEITKKRARFYINIVLKKGGMMPQNLFPPLQQQPNQLTPLTQQQTMDIAQAINTFRSPQVADSVGRTDFAAAIRGIDNVLPRFRLGLQTHYGNQLTIQQIENYVTGARGATELYSQFNVGGKIGGALRDDVDFMFNYIETNFLQDRPDVVSYINTLDDDERISMVLNYIKDDNGDISRAVNMMEEGNFTFELSSDINNLVNELILIGNDEGANTDSETRSIEGGALSDTDAIVMALGSAGGLFVLNELYKFAYNRIMGNRPVPPPVANFIIARPVPNGIPRAIARVVQRELVPAHYAVYPHEYSAPLADVEVRDIETGRGQGKSKVKVAPEPTKVAPKISKSKVAPEPEEEYQIRISPEHLRKIEQKRMAKEDPLITETLRKRAELKNILKETLGGTGNKKSHTNNIGKMANSWIMYVKDFAKKNNMKYNEALKSPACKAGYRKGKEGMGMHTMKKDSGMGMPTSREAFAAEQYDQRNLGANGKVILN